MNGFGQPRRQRSRRRGTRRLACGHLNTMTPGELLQIQLDDRRTFRCELCQTLQDLQKETNDVG